MKKHNQWTSAQRYEIGALLEEKRSKACMAKYLGVHATGNGKGFSEHERIAQEPNVNFYFAKPYHSWQRGQMKISMAQSDSISPNKQILLDLSR